MKDQVIVVTGAAGVLGGIVAQEALAHGARVAMLDLASVEFFRGDAQTLAIGDLDLTDFSAAQAAMDQVKAAFGQIHVLLNIAGGFRWETLEDGDAATWDRLFDMNLKTAVNACKAALPHLVASGDGRIVNVGALSAASAGAGMGAYAASKAGVAKLTESLAHELKGRVRVNAVLPSVIDTPANRKSMANADYAAWVKPQDLAKVILFLAGPDARAITGALLPVVGG